MASNHPMPTVGMRDCQIEGITNLEQSFVSAKPRALIQMATGAGKTFTACAFAYRLIKHAGAKRILFLVDRAANLPAPEVIAREIMDDLEAALEQFREIAEDLEEKA